MKHKKEERTNFRTVRLRGGLTQTDVAYLAGLRDHTFVSMLESQARGPSLNLIISYKLIFGVKVSTLIPEMLKTRKRKVRQRAIELLPRVSSLPETLENQKRVEMIKQIIGH